jgi:Calx-beta domain/Domain of unknown function (DUF4214)
MQDSSANKKINSIRFTYLRAALTGCMLLTFMLALSSVSPVMAQGKDCSGGFTVTLSDGRAFNGTQDTNVAVGSGMTALVRGKFVEFTVNLDTFKVTNYTLTSNITANRPAVIFASQEPLHGRILTGSLSIDINNEQLVLERSGSGIDMKIQAKDCSEGGIFQIEPEQTIEIQHVLGAEFFYCLDALNRVVIVSASNPFIGRENPETATLVEPASVAAIVGTRSSRWRVVGDGHMDLLTGGEAVEPLNARPSCAGTTPTPTPSPTPSPSPSPFPTPSPSPSPFPTPSPSPSPGDERYTARFSSATYSAGEGSGSVNVTVQRTGDTTREAKVDVGTSNGTASDRSDFTVAFVRLRFAAGETTKTFPILITDDALVESNETLNVFIIEASNSGTIGTPASAVVTILDNDTAATSTVNPLEQTQFFVRQHYRDFLNREPEPPGLAAWSRILETCDNEGRLGSSDQSCDRVEVSSAFFRSPEFQERGFFIYRFYEAALGRRPRFAEFTPDMARLNGPQTAAEQEANKVAFIAEFMTRAEFRSRYDQFQTAGAFVDALFQTAGVTLANRDTLVSDLAEGRKTRAQVLREIVESPEVYVRTFNRAFVTMEYFGYLRRDPDENGYNHWVSYLNATGDYRTLVFGFVYSPENRQRFGEQ